MVESDFSVKLKQRLNLKLMQTYGPNFRPGVNILLVDFGGGSSCSSSCCYRGKTKSTPRLSLGLGLEFDNRIK